MNIHFMAGQRINAPKGHKPSSAGTQPPRTRPGKTYPGGKVLRQRLGRLAVRKAEVSLMKDSTGYTIPGSMRG